MKKITLFIFLVFGLSSGISCEKTEDDSSDTRYEQKCGTHNGTILYLGPQGGRNYYNSSGNKTYVDRLECSC